MYWKFALSYLTNYNLKTDSINTEKKYLIVFKKKTIWKKEYNEYCVSLVIRHLALNLNNF